MREKGLLILLIFAIYIVKHKNHYFSDMKILLLGSGGREHAIAWKIAQSPKVEKLYIAPGNAGTTNCGENINVSVSDFKGIKKAALEKGVDMVVVGPEAPLVDGIYDFFKNDAQLKSIPVIGPSKEGAQMEGSKDFSKQFMMRHNIPTAGYLSVTKDNIDEGVAFLKSHKAPYVLKADGLAAGKGVLILNALDEAIKELGKDICMQIAAMRPQYLNKESVPADVLAKEKEILMAQTINEGKPANVAEKIVNGRINKFYEENCLTNQAFVKENKMSVEKYAEKVAAEQGGTVKIARFVRFEKGEGLAKREDNFADEVASMIK